MDIDLISTLCDTFSVCQPGSRRLCGIYFCDGRSPYCYPPCRDSGYFHAADQKDIYIFFVVHCLILPSYEDYLSVEDACEVSLPQLTRGQTPLEVGDVALEVDQGLVVFLHVGLQAVAVVVVLTRPTVPHNNVKNGLTLLLI